jgi:hypothetical protein
MKPLTAVSTALACALLLAAPISATPQQKPDDKKAAEAPGAAGKWTLSAETPHGAMDFQLALKQDGAKLTGTFTTPAGDIPVEGEVVKGVLTFKMTQAPDGYPALAFKARLKDDGTMAGTMSSDNGDMAFTGKRAK